MMGNKKIYSLDDAIQQVKDQAKAKFDESIDIAISLGIDARKSDQTVRGSVVLPGGTGKTVRVAVFCRPDKAEAAVKAGADIVGDEDLADTVAKGVIEFDRCVATPDMMAIVGKLGKVLGPKGLMPNPRLGTVTADVEAAVKAAKGGQVTFRADKGGIVHAPLGKVSFTISDLKGNVDALLSAVVKEKPSGSKGVYLRKIVLNSTMGPGIGLDVASLQV